MAAAQFKLFAFLLSLCVLASSTQVVRVRYCTKMIYDVKVSGVDISPYPVETGKLATFSIAASTDKKISGGKLEIGVSIFSLLIHSETHDLCTETSCPVPAGDFVISHSQVLPIFTPHGTYTLKMKLKDEDGNELTCISFSFKIGSAASIAVADI